MVLEIAGGIVLGGLVLAFLLKTRAGWYVLIGAPVAAVVGVLWGLLVYSVLNEPKPRSEHENLAFLFSIPVFALGAGFWVSRTIAHYKATTASAEGEEVDGWKTFKSATEEAWTELIVGLMTIAFLGGLFVAPFVWRYASPPLSVWAKIAAIVTWAIAALLAGVSLVARLRDRMASR